jgi:transcriptional regulator with XRE-family HTH domain
MDSKNHIMAIGNEISAKLNEKSLTQKYLAEIICEKFPLKDDGSERHILTTINHISRLVRGKAFHVDTFNKVIEILEVEIRFNNITNSV